MKLSHIQKEYEQILHSDMSNYQKAIKYARLMTDMEGYFNIPMLKNKEFEGENRAVIAMYRKLSRSRSFEE